MSYFTNIHNADELKLEYRRLAKELHPDKGGNSSEFQRMKMEYEERLTSLLTNSTKQNNSNNLETNKLLALLIEYLKETYPMLLPIITSIADNPLIEQLCLLLPPKEKKLIQKVISFLNKVKTINSL